MTGVSIIIPVLNEATALEARRSELEALQRLGHEVVVIDGGSDDQSLDIARAITPAVGGCTPPGRARQMNAGARRTQHGLLLFLHADTAIGAEAVAAAYQVFERRGALAWGRFDVRLQGDSWGYRVIESMMNLRSRVSGIATGDQAIFVSRTLFDEVGGFPDIPLMEDIALCKALRGRSRPTCLRQRVAPSTRRWARHGILATTVLMWRLRLAYFLGANPARLARIYYGAEAEPGS